MNCVTVYPCSIDLKSWPRKVYSEPAQLRRSLFPDTHIEVFWRSKQYCYHGFRMIKISNFSNVDSGLHCFPHRFGSRLKILRASKFEYPSWPKIRKTFYGLIWPSSTQKRPIGMADLAIHPSSSSSEFFWVLTTLSISSSTLLPVRICCQLLPPFPSVLLLEVGCYIWYKISFSPEQ